jgi:hypothetical protein
MTSLSNYKFGDLVDGIYSIELEIKETTYIDLHLEIDSKGRLRKQR